MGRLSIAVALTAALILAAGSAASSPELSSPTDGDPAGGALQDVAYGSSAGLSLNLAAAQASSGAIDAGIRCFTGCYDGENSKKCATSCSSDHGLAKTDWQDAFVKRCDPPPTTDKGTADCIVILAIVAAL